MCAIHWMCLEAHVLGMLLWKSEYMLVFIGTLMFMLFLGEKKVGCIVVHCFTAVSLDENVHIWCIYVVWQCKSFSSNLWLVSIYNLDCTCCCCRCEVSRPSCRLRLRVQCKNGSVFSGSRYCVWWREKMLLAWVLSRWWGLAETWGHASARF